MTFDINSLGLEPASRVFGFDRGTPIDRYYVRKYLCSQAPSMRGKVIEMHPGEYGQPCGAGFISQYETLSIDKRSKAHIIGDLTDPKFTSANDSICDCFICPQTLQAIYNIKDAVRGIYQLLKPGGILLATFNGISQISRQSSYPEYWRLTSLSVMELFNQFKQRQIQSYGNVKTATAFLHGLAIEELAITDLNTVDPDYEVLICLKATK